MPTTKFLFWNLNGKPLVSEVAELAHERKVDVLILVEVETQLSAILLSLNQDSTAAFRVWRGISPGIRIFTRFSQDFLIPTFESERSVIAQLVLPARSEILLAVAHFPSKLHWTTDSQSYECGELARVIMREEEKVNHHRTVLVGDFNMNPFEHGMVAAAGHHSVMSREIANRTFRTVQGREYPFFYNPPEQKASLAGVVSVNAEIMHGTLVSPARVFPSKPCSTTSKRAIPSTTSLETFPLSSGTRRFSFLTLCSDAAETCAYGYRSLRTCSTSRLP